MNELRQKLVKVALEWQSRYDIAPSITSTISEYDAARLVGMSNSDYAEYMSDNTVGGMISSIRTCATK